MKPPARKVAWLLPLLLAAGCHRNHKAPVQATAPPAQPPSHATAPPAPVIVQAPVGTIPAQPAPATSSTAIAPPPESKPPVHHHKPPAKPAQQAANEAPAVSVIGQLSSGDPTAMRRETDNSIQSTERTLNNISRSLNYQEQKTAAQIREFLKQAKAALASGDVDGAHTLAQKASVLLGELNH